MTCATARLVSVAVLAMFLAGCGSTGGAEMGAYERLSKDVGSGVTITGELRPGVVGPIVAADDYTAVAIGGRPFEPDHAGTQVTISGRLQPNPNRFENGTHLPLMLTDVRWKGMEDSDMPRTLYIRPRSR